MFKNVVESTGANIHTTLLHHVIFSTKITHWSKTLMKGIFSKVSITEQHGDHKRKFLVLSLIFV